MEQLAGKIATDEADHKAAGEISAKEGGDFTALEKEPTEIVDTCTVQLDSWKDMPPWWS